MLTGDFSNDDWYIDSGATAHMSMRKDWIVNCKNISNQEITIANNQKVSCNATGEIKVKLKDDSTRTITEVMYVPDLSANLLSVSKMVNKNMTVVFDLNGCKVYDSRKCEIKGRPEVTASNVGGIYKLDKKNVK